MKLQTIHDSQPRAHGRSVAASLFTVLLVSTGLAQTTAPTTPTAAAAAEEEDKGEVIELSPFTVDASQDQGYRATSTLAGSRINTNLKDIAAAITEITPEFLKDVAAADINDVIVYTAGTEGTRNYTAAPAAGIGGYDDTTSTSPNTANRVRGLHSAQLMRDYFVTIGAQVGFDSYNVDRVTINRGPNSVLFGLGDPSGSINYAPKLAQVARNRGEVGVRYGSNDDIRLTLDANQVLVDEKLALRLTALWSDRGYEQQPAYYKDRRVYLTGTYKPFEKSTFRIGLERAGIRQNSPNSITPIDNVSGWVEAGRPTWDSRTQAWSTRPSYFASIAGAGTIGATAPDGTLTNTWVDGISGSDIRFPTFYQPATPGVLIFSALGVSSSKFVDLHKKNLRPSITNRDLDTFTAAWDQQITRDLFFNIAYLKENMDSLGHGWYRANQFAINVDVNTHLPNGTPNPHFGEMFMPQRSLDSLFESDNGNEALRGTASYTVNFTENEGWARWLGRHAFTGFVEKREDDFVSKGYNGTRTGSPSYLNPADKINAGDWQITYIRYHGATPDGRVTAPAGVPPQIGASGVPHIYWNATTSSWAQDTWGDYYARKRLDAGKNEVSSRALVWQSFFLNDRISGLVGIRKDKQGRANVSYTNRNPATGETDFPVDPVLPALEEKSGDTKTYGVVVHPTDWLSLHYNKSETIQVFAGGSLNLFGEPIPLPTGPGKDYGFTLNLMEGKLNMRLNWYETDITNARMGFLGPVVAGQWELPWFDQVVIPNLAAAFGQTWTASDQFTSITYGDARVAETSDESAEGLEIEVTFNPTRNWRIMANATKQKAVQSNIAPGLTRWKEEVLPVWQSKPWWSGTIPTGYTNPWGFTGNLQGHFTTYNSGRVLDTFKAFENQTNPELREWRFNLVNNYTFTEGRFKGWYVGGAFRWEDKAAIGYPAISQVINGTPTLVGIDLANAYTDNGNASADAWVGFTRKVFGDRYEWNLQLNVRDIGNSDNLQPIVKNSDASTAVYRIEFGPTWYLSSTFSW